jgi:hypothetical protein
MTQPDYKTATDWRAGKPHRAHKGDLPCVLCGEATPLCADCTLPAVAGDDTKEPLPGGDAWFVPICPTCFEQRRETKGK